MQELLDRFRELNFNPPDIQLDGQIHRFDRDGNENAWYIGWKNVGVRNGKTYAVAMFGDWKTAEQHQYKPTKDVSAEDKAAIKVQIDQAMKRAAEQKVERQREASEKADKSWSKCEDVFESEYFERKLIAEGHGTKTFLTEAGRVIVVPMRDVEGVLWGLQRIFPDGAKKFLPGQRVMGTMHVIGEMGSDVLICEGFATGASLRLATGKPVVVAFNAGNLVEVSKQIRKKFPDIALTICGDDDRWNETNAGREKATKAAMISQAGVIFPVFASVEEGKPTDFNDLHVREGIEAVRRHFEKEQSAETGFIPLGYDEGTYFFYHVPSRDIVKASTFSKNQLFQIAPAEYWGEFYPSKNGTNFDNAMNDLIQMSRKIGPFDSSRVRGTGVWMDGDRIVINTGHSLIVDGAEMGLSSLKSWYIYVQTRNRLPPLREPLRNDETSPLLDACIGLRWREEKSGYLLAGWLAIARIAGALAIRPHVWVTGGAGTGKSTVMERLVSPCLGTPKGKIYLQGASTEAGIRQRVKSSAVPLIFDEFETTGAKSQERVAALVELLRNSWSSTQGTVVKGSASGFSVEYQLSFAALVSSIRVNLETDADRSRFTVLELTPHGNDPGQKEAVMNALAMLTEDFGERLFARSTMMVPVIQKSAAVFADALAGVISQRFGQQVGTLLAGYWSLACDRVVTRNEADRVISNLSFADDRDEASITDEQECLRHLMTWRVPVRVAFGIDREVTRDLSIADAINDGYAEQVKAFGLMADDDFVYISNDHAELRRIFSGSRWPKWSASLRRLPGAEQTGTKWFSKGEVHRTVKIPRKLL